MNGKQLKNSILQWAIQGKLVPQDPNDESASVLLERIRTEKARLVKEGKIKKDKNESIIFRGDDNSHYEKFLATGEVKCIDDEIPFEIPEGWEWCRLGFLSEIIGGYAFESSSLKASFGDRVIRISDIDETGFVNNKIVRYNGTAISEAYRIKKLDILLAMTGGTVGKSLYVKTLPEDSLLLNQRVAIIRNRFIDSDYLDLVIKSPHIKDVINSRKNSTNDNISMTDIYNFLIPIPAVRHQTVIVKAFSDILPLIDRYGVAKFSLDRLNTNIKATIQKSVLQEAIQGKLVPQDPADEPASVLLDRIREEKQRLLKEGKLKKKDITDSIIFKGDDNKYYERIGTEIAEIELPFSLPESWAIVKLHSISALIDGEKRTGNYICLDAKYLRGKSYGEQMKAGRFVHSSDNIILVDGENSGEVFTAPIDGYLGSTFKQLWVSETLYLPYVLACIRFYKEELRNSKKGAAIPHLNKDIFRNLIVGIPPISEQFRIMQKIEFIQALL